MVVRKLTILLIFVFYSLASFGVSVNFFFCCGKLKEVSLKPLPSATKDCPVQKGKNCCENKALEAKVSEDQKNNSFIMPVLDHPDGTALTPPFLFTIGEKTPDKSYSLLQPKEPPEALFEDLPVLLSIFRI